jgi:branched-chain amino acid aminotransferase
MTITKADKSRINEVDFDNLGFGQVFSDHMLTASFSEGAWRAPKIVPYGNIEISPSICSLHYGQAVFEGIKAFRTKNGSINLFRPETYHARFNRSCGRLCIPPMDYDLFFSGMKELLLLDQAWIPKKRGCSLYIRPFVFAADNFLGVHAAKNYLFMIITSPVGAYYKEGLNPVSLITSGEYVRAVKGGIGAAKTPGNYAASLLPAEKAIEQGYTQVLWLDAVERKYVEEVGTMNIFFLIDGVLVTPPLEGSILAGVTRDSVLRLAKEWGAPVREDRITINEVFEQAKAGRLQEVFGTGTAAVISPVGRISHEGETIVINDEKIGAFSQKLYDEITSIQYGDTRDRLGWIYPIAAK